MIVYCFVQQIVTVEILQNQTVPKNRIRFRELTLVLKTNLVQRTKFSTEISSRFSVPTAKKRYRKLIHYTTHWAIFGKNPRGLFYLHIRLATFVISQHSALIISHKCFLFVFSIKQVIEEVRTHAPTRSSVGYQITCIVGYI